jgi:type III pantothenate kinase
MLLVIDIGNTNTVLGVFDGSRRQPTEARTKQRQTAMNTAFWRAIYSHWPKWRSPKSAHRDRFGRSATEFSLGTDGAKYFKLKPLFVEPGENRHAGVVRLPADVGADRIVTSGRLRQACGPVIVVDFGTATTFDAIWRRVNI